MISNDDLIFHLNRAVQTNDLKSVKEIAQHLDVSTNDSYALQLAARRDFFTIAEFLLPFATKTDATLALLDAIDFGHTRMVKILLPHSLPKSNKSEALQYAVATGKQHLIDLIYPKSSPHVALKDIANSQGHGEMYHQMRAVIEAKDALKLKSRLNAEVNPSVVQRRKKM